MPPNKIDIQKIKVKIMKDHAFWGSLLHRVTFQESTEIPTGGMTRDHIMILNPDYYASLSEAKQMGLACHEILHDVFDQVNRIFKYSTPQDHRLGNEAADYLINAMIIDAGMQLPDGALLNPDYTPDKYTVETLMEVLRKKRKEENKPSNTGSEACAGDDLLNRGKELSPAEQRQQDIQTKMDIASAVMIAKKRGTLPGMLERFASDILKPDVRWQEELHDWFNVKVRSESSWNRPNRRFMPLGMYMPSQNSLGCGHVGVAIDVSGSIGQAELTKFSNELNYLFETCKPSKVTVAYFDTSIRRVEEYDEFPIQLKATGGGGTHFKAAFDHFNQKCSDITGLVFMTDMYGEWPNEPAYPVCVLSTTKGMVAPYGKTIYADMTK